MREARDEMCEARYDGASKYVTTVRRNTMATLELSDALEKFLLETTAKPWRVSDLERLAGGASAEIYAFCAKETGQEPRRLVLRMESPGGGLMKADLHREFEFLAAARRAGLSVPRVYWKGRGGDGLPADFFIMDHVEGQALARKLLRDDRYKETRQALPDQLAAQLARLHAIDTSQGPLTFLSDELDSAVQTSDSGRYTRLEIDRYLAALDLAGHDRPYPLLRLAARWLGDNIRPLESPALVHGDFRIGNIMFDEAGLTAVLDWELCHLGDPIEDLGWLCVRAWRFGNDADSSTAVGGLCDRRRLLESYHRAGGMEVDSDQLRYWEIFGNWKWAIICISQAGRHKAGTYADVELATIGRRVAETEWELLSLLEEI